MTFHAISMHFEVGDITFVKMLENQKERERLIIRELAQSSGADRHQLEIQLAEVKNTIAAMGIVAAGM